MMHMTVPALACRPRMKKTKRYSDTGNRTPSCRVRGGNVSRYTISDLRRYNGKTPIWVAVYFLGLSTYTSLTANAFCVALYYTTRPLCIFTSSRGLQNWCQYNVVCTCQCASLVLRIDRDSSQALHDSHARAHAPEDGVLLVKVRCRGQGDEELRA